MRPHRIPLQHNCVYDMQSPNWHYWNTVRRVVTQFSRLENLNLAKRECVENTNAGSDSPTLRSTQHCSQLCRRWLNSNAGDRNATARKKRKTESKWIAFGEINEPKRRVCSTTHDSYENCVIASARLYYNMDFSRSVFGDTALFSVEKNFVAHSVLSLVECASSLIGLLLAVIRSFEQPST